jgi:hypothetical protein
MYHPRVGSEIRVIRAIRGDINKTHTPELGCEVFFLTKSV